MTVVVLTPDEFGAAVSVGTARLVASAKAGHNHASTLRRTLLERLRDEVIGACAEAAVCRVLDVEWSRSVGTFHREPDVIGPQGQPVEVRATTLGYGRLPVRENDPDDRLYVLVTGGPPRVTVHGFILGSEAKRPEWSANPHGYRPVWLVPQRELRPLDDLPVPF